MVGAGDEPERVRFAVGLPNVGIFGDPKVLVELGCLAEDAGWDGVFLWDHVLYHDPGWPVADPTVAMTAIATRTTAVKVGIMMTAVPRRQVDTLARETASLDVISDGRLVFGAGLGSMPQEYTKFGRDDTLTIRAQRLDESLNVLAALWSGEFVEAQGRHLTVNGVRMLPTPIQRPRPPVWCAGRWPTRAPFRRAARWDGVMPTHADYGRLTTMPPSDLADIVRYITTERGQPGPSARPDRTGTSHRFDVALEGATAHTAPRRGADTVAPYLPAGLTWWVEALGWWRGDIDAARRRVSAGPPDL